MIKIIYLDIDGTLRDEQIGIPKSAVWAIHQCKLKGIQIVICTGRNPASIQNDVKELPTDGTISGGGCYIVFHKTHFWKKHFSNYLLEEVLFLASKWNLSFALESEQNIYMGKNAADFYKYDFQHKISQIETQGKKTIIKSNKINYENNIDDFWKEPQKVHKICIFGSKEKIIQTEKVLSPKTEIIQIKEWNQQWYLELLPKGCNKGSAITWLNHRLGISKNQSMSFGDSENDISMLEATGVAVAVENSSSYVKSFASSICEPLTEDGIYKELLRRNLINPFSLERSKG